MKNYVIDHVDENKRLNFQNTIDIYNLDKELKFFSISDCKLILDAGCGNGNVIEKLDSLGKFNIHGVDLSSDRVSQAKARFSANSNVHIFNRSLDNTQLKDSEYDAIICRYIFEHVLNHKDILTELYRILKPGCSINIINFDDLFFNFYTKNESFNKQLAALKQELPLDLQIGRKLPHLLRLCHFENIKWEAETYYFKGERLILERENTRMRLEQGRDHLIKYFKNNEEYDQFARIYLEEMLDECNVLSMNKYLITATKPSIGKVLKF